MGTWADDPFGNDSACDWAQNLKEVSDLSFIEETIQRVLDVGDAYLEASTADEAIAAADVVARLGGKFYAKNSYTKSVDGWVVQHQFRPSPELVARALKAIDRIMSEPSELFELWNDGADYDGWKQQMAALKDRLK